MKLGIYIPDISKSEGGGFSYTNFIVDYFNSNPDLHHQFTFIIDSDSAKSYLQSKSVSDIEFFDSEKGKVIPEQEELANLKRQIKRMHSLKYRLRLKILAPFIEILEEKSKLKEQIIKTKQFDLFAKNAGIDLAYYPYPFQTLSLNFPFIATVWDLGHITLKEFSEISDAEQFEFRDKLYGDMLPKAQYVICESDAGKQLVKDNFSVYEPRLKVIPMPPASYISAQIPDGLEVEFLKKNNLTQSKYLFYPAQFWPHKNHVNMLEAFAKICKEAGDLSLVLCGSNKGALSQIKAVIELLKITEKVRILNFLPDEEVKILYENAFCLFYPSFLGPTNMPLIEAAILGCPVVCSGHDGHIEQLGDAALYFDPHNIDLMADQVIKLYNSPEDRAKLIQKAKSRVNSKYQPVSNLFTEFIEALDEYDRKRRCWA